MKQRKDRSQNLAHKDLFKTLDMILGKMTIPIREFRSKVRPKEISLRGGWRCTQECFLKSAPSNMEQMLLKENDTAHLISGIRESNVDRKGLIFKRFLPRKRKNKFA